MKTKMRSFLYDRWMAKESSDDNSNNFREINALNVGFGNQYDDFKKDPWWDLNL